MDLDVVMRSSDCEYIVKFYGALFTEVITLNVNLTQGFIPTIDPGGPLKCLEVYTVSKNFKLAIYKFVTGTM